MKRAFLALWLALCLLAPTALADEAGVLTETELNTWLQTLLRSTLNVQPLNAPVGEDALTQDGYAFLYESATLYYNKPVLDAQSVLNAVAVTGESLDMPRGVRLGAPASMLLSAYAWQNPTLAGDESFAPLYTLDRLPQAAYWGLAQRSGDALQSVQCAIHASMGNDRYTDAGVLYTVQDDVVSAIRIYGLSASTDAASVRANLTAVTSGSGKPSTAPAQGVTDRSDAQPFGKDDLRFGRLDFLTLTEKGAAVLFGETTDETWAQDAGGQWLHTLTYAGASLLFALDANRENPTLESLTLTGEALVGPRGLAAGTPLAAAMALFRSEGSGAVADGAALLYGDGETLPFGTLERTGNDATLRYAAAIPGADGTARTVALHLTFVNGLLAELTLYTL